MIDRIVESGPAGGRAADGARLYFAYGSNMCAVQMAGRCPDAVGIGVGWVAQHILAFNRKGTYRPGGVASIVRTGHASDRAYGVIWRISAADLGCLDTIEHPNAYERRTVEVLTAAHVHHFCEAYISIPQAEYVAPDAEYLDLLLSGARAAKLPATYISNLSRFRTRE